MSGGKSEGWSGHSDSPGNFRIVPPSPPAGLRSSWNCTLIDGARSPAARDPSDRLLGSHRAPARSVVLHELAPERRNRGQPQMQRSALRHRRLLVACALFDVSTI